MDEAVPPVVARVRGRGAPTRVIAIVQAAGRRIGIDGTHVVQAVVVPDDMAGVPRRAGGIVGVIAHGTQLVPVVRLENWLASVPAESDDAVGEPLETSPDARIVILGGGPRVVGLLVDALVGMQRCTARAVARLFHDERPDELFAGAVRLDDASPPLPLLEPERLAALAGVWCAAAELDLPSELETEPDNPKGQDDPAVERTSVAVLRIGDVFVGIAVADIGELVRVPALRPPPLRHASSRGLCDWRDRLLPVVDIGGLLGAQPGAESPAWMCVVRHAGRVLGVLVHEIVELHGADAPTSHAETAASLVRCEWAIAAGIVQVLDTAALMASCPESGISLRADAGAAAGTLATSPHTWLVFESGGCHASRIDHVQEIVPVPAALRSRLDAGLAVSLQWRGHVVPVRDLFTNDLATRRAARLLIVVESEGRRVAVPIAGVKAMIAPRTATLSRLRVRAEVVDIVSTAAGPEQASYEAVDLQARVVAEQGLQQAA